MQDENRDWQIADDKSHHTAEFTISFDNEEHDLEHTLNILLHSQIH